MSVMKAVNTGDRDTFKEGTAMTRAVALLGLIVLGWVVTAPALAQQPSGPHAPAPGAATGGTHGGRTGGGMGGPGMGPMMMSGMCPMMSGGMMPMMGLMNPSDPKTQGRILKMRGEMMKAMGEIMLKHGQAMEEGK
jgi:hypothetical protein